jgi:hypothetical protein
LSTDKYGKTVWHNAAERGQVEILEKLWDWAKELQLKPKQLRNEVFSTDKYGKTVSYKAANRGQVEILEKLWDWVNELQLETYMLRYEILLSKEESEQMAGDIIMHSYLWDGTTIVNIMPTYLRISWSKTHI